MTSMADTDDRVVSLARGMRDLVRAEAGESERGMVSASGFVCACAERVRPPIAIMLNRPARMCLRFMPSSSWVGQVSSKCPRSGAVAEICLSV